MPTLNETETNELRKCKLYKITSQAECHHGFQYQDGLNTDIKPFNPEGSCEPGGLYFSEVKDIFNFLNYGIYVRKVTIPEGEIVYKDPQGNKYKCHSIILGKRRKLWTKTMFEKLIKEGADIHAREDLALRDAAEDGRYKIVKLLLESGADIRVGNDYALRWAAAYGRTEVVDFLNNWIKEHG